MAEYGPRLPDPRRIPPWTPPPPSLAPTSGEAVPAQAGGADDDRLFVRPFLVTGGRTRPLHDGLRIETSVSAAPAALSAPLRFEVRRIVELCQRPLSVAEVAVRLGVPLGVARVLVGDLITDGYVSFSQPAEIPIDVLERIRDRVRAL